KAQEWVRHIEYSEEAQDGVVLLEGTDWTGQAAMALDGVSKWTGMTDFRPGDAILCRLTRPLVAAAFALIRARIPCRMLGRDIGAGLTALIKRAKMREDSLCGAFAEWLDEYCGLECARLRGKGEDAKAGVLEDKADTLRVFLGELSSSATVAELIAEVEGLF